MTELDSIREQIGELRESRGALTANVQTLTTQVEALTKSIATLNETMAKGRGALWAIVSAASVVGGLVTYLTTVLAHK
jgi:prefoldin subunit 5